MNTIFNENCVTGLSKLPEKSVRCCVTSPPYYGLRDYGHSEQIGLEQTPEEYINKLVEVFRQVKRVLTDDGTLWVNIGDTYSDKKQNGLKAKDLIGIPWMLAFALRSDGWYLRQDIIWHKKDAMPDGAKDRCTKAHEYFFLLSKNKTYFFNADAIKEKVVTNERVGKSDKIMTKKNAESTLRGDLERVVIRKEFKNKRSVWSTATASLKEAHFAAFPDKLISPCIMAGSEHGDLILDPFIGSGTVAEVALRLGRKYVGFEINPDYIKISENRLYSFKNEIF